MPDRYDGDNVGDCIGAGKSAVDDPAADGGNAPASPSAARLRPICIRIVEPSN